MEFAASFFSAALEVGTELMIIVSIVLLVVIFAFLALPTIFQFLYTVLDESDEPIQTRGKILEKRSFSNHWSAQVEVNGLIGIVPLPPELFRSVDVGDEIDLSVHFGKHSKRLLSVKPIRPQVNTFA